MATETATVLFTDLVGSTALRARLGEETADALRRTHDALLAAAVDDAGGTIVKGLGDGVMATFASAADAVAAGVAMQQAAWRQRAASPHAPIELRIGISVGDVAIEDGDCFGSPVVEASRLCAAASGGQILVADLVRAMARGRGGHRFEPVGDLELKGLPDPVPACLVSWETPLDPGDGHRPPFPPLLGGSGTIGYVGRVALLDALRSAWTAASGGTSRTVLLSGEPGVGKTHTAAEVARAAWADGATVLYGRCDEALAVPHQPFVEALDQYTSNGDAGPLGRLPGELARLLPDLGLRVPDLPSIVASDARTEEHRLLEAAASWLIDAARSCGLVLVIDDLHWAARPTLLVLLHVVRSAAADPSARVLVVGTYRDTDVDRTHPLSATMADLRRLPGVERLAVNGLSVDEVVAMVSAAAGHELDAPARALAVRIHEETEGNPFVVGEVARHLVETGAVRRVDDRWVVADPDAVAVPEGVRDVVGRRVGQLSDVANTLLTAASVVGRDFTLDVVRPLVGAPEDEVLDALDEALRARLVEEIGADCFRFGHALVRTTLYEELSATRRRRLHRRVADVLEKERPDDVVALSHHTVEAGPDGGDHRRAVTYTLAAADQALAARAIGDAAARFRLVLELLDDGDGSDEAARIEALCGLGECQRTEGDGAARATLLEAARAARAAGRVDLLVRATLANSRGFASLVGNVDVERVELLEAAVEAAGNDMPRARPILLATLAAELLFDPRTRLRRGHLVDEALAAASALGDDTIAADTGLRAAMPRWSPATWHDMTRWSADLLELAERTGDPARRCLAHYQAAIGALHAGDVRGARRLAGAGLTLARTEGMPTLAWMFEAFSCQLLLYDGDVAGARAANDAALALGTAAGEGDAQVWWGAMHVCSALLEGVWGDMADLIGSFADSDRGTQSWRASHVSALAYAGRLDECAALLPSIDVDELLAEDGEIFTLASWITISFAVRSLDERALAARLLPVVERHLDEWAGIGLFLLGPVRFAVSAFAGTLGDHDRAIATLRESDDLLANRGLHLHRLWSTERLVAELLARGGPGDRGEAAGLAAGAVARAEQYGLPRWTERFAAALGA